MVFWKIDKWEVERKQHRRTHTRLHTQTYAQRYHWYGDTLFTCWKLLKHFYCVLLFFSVYNAFYIVAHSSKYFVLNKHWRCVRVCVHNMKYSEKCMHCYWIIPIKKCVMITEWLVQWINGFIRYNTFADHQSVRLSFWMLVCFIVVLKEIQTIKQT